MNTLLVLLLTLVDANLELFPTPSQEAYERETVVHVRIHDQDLISNTFWGWIEGGKVLCYVEEHYEEVPTPRRANDVYVEFFGMPVKAMVYLPYSGARVFLPLKWEGFPSGREVQFAIDSAIINGWVPDNSKERVNDD